MPLANNSLVQAGHEWVTGVQPVKEDTSIRPVPNPFGVGASAYEPNTVIYDPGNDPLMAGSSLQASGQDAIQAKEAKDAASAASTANTGAAGSPVANGSALDFINAAKQLLGKPYVWGGTTINGTDCSGLLYYAFNKAGIKMPRYRASDYGRMGQQVSADQAQPGDIVYWDEPGSVDHVGIYLGNGLVLNSPHSGTTTQIDHVWGNPVYRRIIADSGFQQMAQPAGPPVLGYNGVSASQVFTGPTPQVVPTGIGIQTTTPAVEERLPTTGFKVRAE